MPTNERVDDLGVKEVAWSIVFLAAICLCVWISILPDTASAKTLRGILSGVVWGLVAVLFVLFAQYYRNRAKQSK